MTPAELVAAARNREVDLVYITFPMRAEERIRQIEAKALKKLKHPNRKKQLESFVVDD